MSSNLPPGVTGNEPQITGEVPFDHHAPFWVGDHPELDNDVAVYIGNGEGEFWDGFASSAEAEDFAAQLNEHYGLRHEDRDEKTGFCRICGDLHGEPPGVAAEA